MNYNFRVPKKRKRIVMLTPDIMIDRRILIESHTLSENGFEVYILAGWDSNQKSLFEKDGDIKIERIKYEGLDCRLSRVYKCQTKMINILNRVSISINNNINDISSKSNNFFNRFLSEKDKLLNNILINLFKKIKNHDRKSDKLSVKQIMVDYFFLFQAKLITIISKLINEFSKIILKLINLFLKMSVKIKNYIITPVAKIINLLFRIYIKLYSTCSELTAYEDLYYKRTEFYRPDIIHVHDLPMLKVGVKIKNKFRIPLVYDMHEFYPEQDVFNKRQRNHLKRTEKHNINYCDLLITVNPLLAEEISKSYGGVKMNVIQNATIVPKDFYDRTYNRFREEYEISDKEIILLYQGWISPHRNLQNIISGLRYVNQPIKFIIMGYGEFSQELEDMAIKLNVRDKVLFVPCKTQEELLTYTASADIGIIPYPYKLDPNTRCASPNKLYEFIAARVPILCNDLPFVKSVVLKNGFGVSVPMDSPESFANAFNKFPFNDMQKFRENLKNYGQKYLWDNEKNNLLTLYDQIDNNNY